MENNDSDFIFALITDPNDYSREAERLRLHAQFFEAAGWGKTVNWVSPDCRFILAPEGWNEPSLKGDAANIPVWHLTDEDYPVKQKKAVNEALDATIGTAVRRPLDDNERHGLVKFSVGYFGQMQQKHFDYPVCISSKTLSSVYTRQFPLLAPDTDTLNILMEAKTRYKAECEKKAEYNEKFSYMFRNCDPIDRFRDEAAFLSNFYESSMDELVRIDGIAYRTAEGAFQSMKTLDRKEREKFAEMNGKTAKAAGKKVQLRSDWEDVKVDCMRQVIASKFAPGTALAEKLMDTLDRTIMEGGEWTDRFWGIGRNGDGENILGKILMEQRDTLFKELDPQKHMEDSLREFELAYRRQLAMLNPQKILADLNDLCRSDEFTLICFEKDDLAKDPNKDSPADTFCHRFIVQQWLAKSILSNALGRDKALIDYDKEPDKLSKALDNEQTASSQTMNEKSHTPHIR